MSRLSANNHQLEHTVSNPGYQLSWALLDHVTGRIHLRILVHDSSLDDALVAGMTASLLYSVEAVPGWSPMPSSVSHSHAKVRTRHAHCPVYRFTDLTGTNFVIHRIAYRATPSVRLWRVGHGFIGVYLPIEQDICLP